jgi:hypothetical protein
MLVRSVNKSFVYFGEDEDNLVLLNVGDCLVENKILVKLCKFTGQYQL